MAERFFEALNSGSSLPAELTVSKAPRRSREMTHLCSDRMTHAKKTFCPRAKKSGVDIIRAGGVQVSCIQQDPGSTKAAGAERRPGGDCKSTLVWWVTFGEQTWVISRERRSLLVIADAIRVVGLVVHYEDILLTADLLAQHPVDPGGVAFDIF